MCISCVLEDKVVSQYHSSARLVPYNHLHILNARSEHQHVHPWPGSRFRHALKIHQPLGKHTVMTLQNLT